ncbi:hypothetical protein [Allokutzneria sp. NRRL B-24872]|uniref:hypothetical protein n=1 Tax=Allokutzneria sp. NRRL B-24872 TaxID=1137961 RepID=UPI001178C5B1|nr:hypothetical protein [Allokutzneria sp. NRRL B-24872]
MNRAAQLGTRAVAAWKKVVGRSPVDLVAGDIVELGVGELFLTLAATKVLARQANSMLIPALTPEQWADEAVRDFRENGPVDSAKPHRLRKLVGWHRFHYQAVPLTEVQLRDAAARCGLPL